MSPPLSIAKPAEAEASLPSPFWKMEYGIWNMGHGPWTMDREVRYGRGIRPGQCLSVPQADSKNRFFHLPQKISPLPHPGFSESSSNGSGAEGPISRKASVGPWGLQNLSVPTRPWDPP